MAGGAIGFSLLIGLSLAGIGALLQASSHALAVLKWVGGAFLPQLIRPGVDLLPQLAALLLVFVVIEIVVEYALALLAHRVRPFLARQGRTFSRVCGSLFIGMGAALPLAR